MDSGTACVYTGHRSSRNILSVPPKSSPGNVPLALSDPSEPGPSHPLPPDLRERSSTPPERLESDVLDKVMPVPSPDASVVERARDATVNALPPTVSSFTILPSIHLQAIHRPLQMPLSVIPPERVQVSSIAPNDLDMILYVFFLSRKLSWDRGS